MPRDIKYNIMPEIKFRWSSRAFSTEKIDEEDVLSIIEAARFAPSCYNEQPWRFIVASTNEGLEKMRSILGTKNRLWANRAPVLVLVNSKRNFSLDNSINRWNQFDAGTAWGYMSLEAERRGLITHCMGGFNIETAKKLFSISEDFDIIAVIAIGSKGDKSVLPADLQKMELPGDRKNINEIMVKI